MSASCFQPQADDQVTDRLRCDASPAVSVIVACFNGSSFLRDCLTSIVRQTLVDLELIVVDDASSDDSAAIADQFAGDDPRVRVLRRGQQGGPSAARNEALALSTGRWVSIVDSDDILHRQRLELLVRDAEAAGVDVAADNQILFQSGAIGAARSLLVGRRSNRVTDVVSVDYVRSNALSGRTASLGYLKPLIRRSVLEHHRIRYDEKLFIAEDYDLVLRLLLVGARFRIFPRLTYFYRRHTASVSHRLTRDALTRMLDADVRLRLEAKGDRSAALTRALDQRRRTIEAQLAFLRLVGFLKRRQWAASAAMTFQDPRVGPLLCGVARDRVVRAIRRPAPSRPYAEKSVCLISRQRVTGRTNGSSVYLLAICESLRKDGWIVDLVCPSPAMFGRWPIFRLQPEMSVFRSINVRGAARLGSFVIAVNPAIAARAGVALLDRVLGKVGLSLGTLSRKAPHAIAVPLLDEDRLFIAGHAGRPDFILADYAFLIDAATYVVAPAARSAVVMHDLFSAQTTIDRPVVLSLKEEIRLLEPVDRVLAIQRYEADIVSQHLGQERVIVVPMASAPAPAAQPGIRPNVLFVGSNTSPNADGLSWFLDDIWPAIASACAGVRLVVVGGVSQAVRCERPDVSFLGRIETLDDVYRDAAVVVSPLRSGSGLKVKLVEALAQGKAVVGTSVTFQGVEHLAGTAAVLRDDASSFAAAVVSLLQDPDARRRLGENAISAADAEFSPALAYSEFLAFARGEQSQPNAARVTSEHRLHQTDLESVAS